MEGREFEANEAGSVERKRQERAMLTQTHTQALERRILTGGRWREEWKEGGRKEKALRREVSKRASQLGKGRAKGPADNESRKIIGQWPPTMRDMLEAHTGCGSELKGSNPRRTPDWERGCPIFTA
jgi:hypothetical protein